MRKRSYRERPAKVSIEIRSVTVRFARKSEAARRRLRSSDLKVAASKIVELKVVAPKDLVLKIVAPKVVARKIVATNR